MRSFAGNASTDDGQPEFVQVRNIDDKPSASREGGSRRTDEQMWKSLTRRVNEDRLARLTDLRRAVAIIGSQAHRGAKI